MARRLTLPATRCHWAHDFAFCEEASDATIVIGADELRARRRMLRTCSREITTSHGGMMSYRMKVLSDEVNLLTAPSGQDAIALDRRPKSS